MVERLLPGLLFGMLSASSFALAAPFARLAFENGVAPVDAVAVRAMVAFFVLSLIIKLSGQKFHVPRDARMPLLGLGLSTTLISCAYLSSVTFIPVGVAVIIFFTFPIFILVLSPFIEKTRFGLDRFVIGLIALFGLYLAVGSTASLANLDWRGVVLAGLGAIAGTGQIFFGRAVARKAHGPTMIWGAHFIILPLTIVISQIFGGALFTSAGFSSVMGLGFVAIGVICLGYLSGYLFQMRALANAPASYIGSVFNVEPIVSTSLAAYLFSERLAGVQYAGGALVLTALVLSSALSLRKR